MKYQEAENLQELVLVGETDLCKVKDSKLLVLFVLKHVGEFTKEIEHIDLVPLVVALMECTGSNEVINRQSNRLKELDTPLISQPWEIVEELIDSLFDFE